VAIFPQLLGIFQPNLTCLLCVPIYDRLRIFIQLPAILMKLCHTKRDHPVHIMCTKCPPVLSSFLRQSCLVFTNVTSALEVFLNVMRYINPRFTYFYLLTYHRPKPTLAFSEIFPKRLGIFSPNFTRLLSVHMYARVQIFIQLSPTLTKLSY